MEKLTKKKVLIRIEQARFILGSEIECGLITTNDIIRLFNKDDHYRLTKVKDYKDQQLRNIANAPFLLCDQDNLDLNIKKILPNILKVRFDTEVEELYYLYENGELSIDELLEKKEMLNFCYYGSSMDGKNILKNGKVKSVVNNRIRCK